MKTIKFFKFFTVAVAALAIGLTSCAKDGSGTTDVEQHDADITIGVKPAETRAVGAIANDNDNKINNFVALAFKANGQLDGEIIESADGQPVVSSGNITTATTKIYVVANAPKTLFAGVTTLSGLEAIVGNLNNAGISTQTGVNGGNVWASGSNNVTFTKNGPLYEAAVNVSIKFVAARINLTVVNNMTERGAVGAFTVNKVALLNAIGSTKFFGTSLIPTPKEYYAGIDMTGFSKVPAPYSLWPVLSDDYDEAESNHYYVFENDATDFPTILTLIAAYDGGTSYCSIHFDAADAKQLIVRGNSYNVTLTLTGSADPNDNEDPGTVDPTIPAVKANVDISVIVEPWNPITVGKEF